MNEAQLAAVCRCPNSVIARATPRAVSVNNPVEKVVTSCVRGFNSVGMVLPAISFRSRSPVEM